MFKFLLKDKKRKTSNRIHLYDWNYERTCSNCKNKISGITSKDLIVTTFSEWGDYFYYTFRVECPHCKALEEIPKKVIPYNVRENVLAETKPILEDSLKWTHSAYSFH